MKFLLSVLASAIFTSRIWRRLWPLFLGAICGLVPSPPVAEANVARVTRTTPTPSLATGFEPEDGFGIGPIHGVREWQFAGGGAAAVVAGGIHGQSLRIAPSNNAGAPFGIVYTPATNLMTSESVLWQANVKLVPSSNGEHDRFGLLLHSGKDVLAEVAFHLDDEGRIFATTDRDPDGGHYTGYAVNTDTLLPINIFVDHTRLRYLVTIGDTVAVPATGMILPAAGERRTPLHLGFFAETANPGNAGNGHMLVDDFAVSFHGTFPAPVINQFAPPPSGHAGTVTGTVRTEGWGKISHQWYLGQSGDTTEPVEGATEPELSLAAGDAAESYWVRLHNAYGHIDSPAQIFGGGSAVWRRFDGRSLPWANQTRQALVIDEHLFVSGFQGSPGRIEAYPLNGSRPDVDLPTSIEQPESIYGYNFGESLAAAGEWLIAGTPAGPYQFSPGKVYVYQKNPDSGDWTVAATLQAPDGGTAGDRFGAAVATDGDWLFVGAPGTASGGVEQRGAVHLFRRDQGGANAWGFVRTLTPESTSGPARFGATISQSGPLLAVGAPAHTAGGSWDAHGAVLVFHRDQNGGGSWGQRAFLRPASSAAVDQFGSAVSLSGSRLAVSAPGAAFLGTDGAGMVTVWSNASGDGRTWTEDARFGPRFAGSFVSFGERLALRGDRLILSDEGPAAGIDPRQIVVAERVPGEERWETVARIVLPGSSDGFGDLALGADFGVAVNESELTFFGAGRDFSAPGLQGSEPLALPAIPRFSTPDSLDGVRLEDLFAERLVDGAGRPLLLAVSEVSVSPSGVWQIRRENQESWNDLPALSSSEAYLLDLRDQVRFVPDTGSFGVATLTFRAWAGGGSPGTFVDTTDAGDDELSAAHVIEQEVVDTNARPTFATQPLTTAFEGVPYTYTVRASDADADQSLTFLADELPDWLSLIPLDNRSARLTGTPPTEAGASYLITLRVTDGDTGHAVQSFTLSPVPADSPEWTLRAPLAWEDGSLYIDALASSGNTLLLAYNLSGERGFKAFDLVLTEDEDPRWVSAGEQVTGTNGLFAFENTTVAVGQPDAAIDLPDGTRIGAGKVQLFERHLGGTDRWGALRAIVSPEPLAGRRFGSFVALASDRLFITEKTDANYLSREGRHLVFHRNKGGAGEWGLEAIIEAPEGKRFFDLPTSSPFATDGNWVVANFQEGGFGLYSRVGETWTLRQTHLLEEGRYAQLALADGILAATRRASDETYALDVWRLDGEEWSFAGSREATESGLFGSESPLLLCPGLLATRHQSDPVIGGQTVVVFDTTVPDPAEWPVAGRLAFNGQANSFGRLLGSLGEGIVASGSPLTSTAQLGYFDLGIGNLAPVLSATGPRTLGSLPEEATADTAPTWNVGALAAEMGADFNGDELGLAVMQTETNEKGRWEYQLGRDAWTEIHSYVTMRARLLPPAAQIRFVPAPDFAGRSPELTVRIWDQTTGASEAWIELPTPGGSSAYSAESIGLRVHVEEIPDAPVIIAPSHVFADPGEAIAIPIQVTDVDAGDTASLTVQEKPSWLTVVPEDSGDSWTLVGIAPEEPIDFYMTVRATDSFGEVSVRPVGVIVRDPATEPETLEVTFPDNGSLKQLRDVGLSGDWIAVSPSVRSTQTGRVSLYRRDAATGEWNHSKTIEGTTSDFGDSVVLKGDRLVIADSTTGTIFIHERDSGGTDQWGRAATFSTPGASRDRYGAAIDVDGNWVAVGAPNSNPTEDFPTYYQGAVYLYRRDSSGNWTYAKEIEIGSPTSADRAGAAVALSGDRLAVGLPGRGRSTRYGAVQVFERNTGGADQWGIEASFSGVYRYGSGYTSRAGSALTLDGNDLVAVSLPDNGFLGHYRLGADGSWNLHATLPDPLDPEDPPQYLNLHLADGVLAASHSHAKPVDDVARGAVYLHKWDETDNSWSNAGVLVFRPDPATQPADNLLSHDGKHLIMGRSSSERDPATVNNLVEIHDLNTPEPMAPGLGAGDSVVHAFEAGSPDPLPVSALIANAANLARAHLGVALVAGMPADGAWSYQLPGEDWLPLPADLSPAHALLLSADARLRFIPNDSTWTGTLAEALRFRIWSGADGEGGDRADTTIPGITFSAGSASVNVEVSPVAADGNTPPVIVDTTPITLTQPEIADVADRPVWRVGDVFAGRLADAETADPDKLSLLVVNGYDQVEFSINGGSSWEPMHRYYPGSGYRYPSLRDAVVLTSSTLLRYNSSAPSTVELTLRATDQLGLHYSVDTLAEGASPLSAEQITLTFETVDVPEAPEIIRLVYNPARVGLAFTGNVVAVDPDSQSESSPQPSLTLQNAPAWLALVDAGDGTGIFTGTPDAAGEVSFTVVAADETGLRDERPVQLAIEAADSVFTWSYPPDIVLPAAASAAASDDGVIVTGHPATRVNNYPDAGTVLIRQRDPATGAVESIGTLIPPEPSSRGRFGSAVAISGQYLYVGASGTGINGSVFVYKRSSIPGNDWTFLRQLTPTETISSGGDFGAALATSGDLLAVGSPNEYNTDYRRVGAVRLYSRDLGGAEQWGQLTFIQPETELHLKFGQAIALADDRLLIGAPGDADGGSAALHTVHRDGTNQWGRAAILRAPHVTAFGTSVAMAGNHLWVGAPDGEDGGTVVLFSRESGGDDSWMLTRTFPSPFPGAATRFGAALAARGDRVIIASPGHTAPHDAVGVLYAFARTEDGSAWDVSHRATPPLHRETLLPLPFASERFFGGVLEQDSGTLTHTFLPETKTPPVVLAGEHVILHPVAEDTPTEEAPRTVAAALTTVAVRDAEADAPGAAVLSVDSSLGVWHYRQAGGDWAAFPALASGEVLLLAPWDELRLTPAPDLHGDQADAVIFHAWTGSVTDAGVAALADIDPAELSSETIAATARILAINDAPVAAEGVSRTLRARATEERAIEIGVAELIGDSATDIDSPDLGLALIAVDNDAGTWSWRDGEDSPWTALPAVSPVQALLLDPDASLQVALADHVEPSLTPIPITFRVWDRASGEGGQFTYLAGPEGDAEDAFAATATEADVRVVWQYLLTLEAQPAEGGTVIGSGWHDAGEAVAIRAVPAPGFAFDGWTGPVTDPAAEETTVVLAENATVLVTFARVAPPLAPTVVIEASTEGWQLHFATEAGVDYRVETSIDLVNWTGLGTVLTGVGKEMTIDLQPADAPRRFYRIIATR